MERHLPFYFVRVVNLFNYTQHAVDTLLCLSKSLIKSVFMPFISWCPNPGVHPPPHPIFIAWFVKREVQEIVNGSFSVLFLFYFFVLVET